MERPTTRLLAVLELLQSHGRLPGPELARRIGVDGRTLRRYIAMLEELGIPVLAERGRFGGYALATGFKLPPMMFGNEEALALSLGLLAARGLGLADVDPAIASAQAKLERVMPAGLGHRLRAIGETVSLDLSQAAPFPGIADALMALGAAARSRQRVRLHYRSARQEESQRDFDAYGLAFRGGRWYVVGHCHLRGGVRSFRLDRIVRVAPLPASFGRPQGFDTLAYLARSLATLPRAHAVDVLIRGEPDAVAAEPFATIGILEAHDGGTLLRAQVDDLDWCARELSRLPFDFDVLRPRELRSALREQGKRLLLLASGRSRAAAARTETRR